MRKSPTALAKIASALAVIVLSALGLAGCGNNDNASATPGNGSGTSTTQSDPGSGKTSDPPKQSSGSGDNPTTLEQFEATIKSKGYSTPAGSDWAQSVGSNGVNAFKSFNVTCNGKTVTMYYSSYEGGWAAVDGSPGTYPSLPSCK